MKVNIFKLAIVSGLILSSCNASKIIADAKTTYASENYCDATTKCAQAYGKMGRKGKLARQSKGDMAFRTAEAYRHIEHYNEANEWYDRAILLDYQEVNPEVYYYNAEMLRMMNEQGKAKENYEKFLALAPGDARGEVGIAACNKNDEFKATRTRHIVANETKINVKEFDMAPMFGDRKEMVMYFGSAREGSTGNDKDPRTCERYMDLWTISLDKKGNWTEPKLVAGEGINTEDNEGTVAFDGRGKMMFFTRCPNVKKQNLGCDIWVSEAKGKEWDEPKKLSLKANDSISVGHPCVSEDGKFLIFTSDMPGGLGGLDLWYSTYDKRSDSWSTPQNMGPQINTAADDMFATFARNGDLYYASNGLPGVGGLDIFRAAKVGEEMKWENPTNVGMPINSENNDYALIEHTERRGYFTSERKSDNGEFVPDIFSYELPPFVYSLKVIAREVEDKTVKVADARVVVTSKSGETWEGFTNKEGAIYWDKKPTGDRYVNEDMTYTLKVSKEGYIDDPKGVSFTTVELNSNQDFLFEIPMLPIKKPIRLPEVRYPLSQWTLLVDSSFNSEDSLLFVYNLLTEYPNMVLELSSHTDSRGGNNPNQVLSENRAKACYKYLVEQKGIDPRRIVPVGKGENEPRLVYRNGDEYKVTMPKDEEGNLLAGWSEVKLTETLINSYKTKNKPLFDMLHQFNRRTEGRVLSMEFDAENAPEANPAYLEFKEVPRR